MALSLYAELSVVGDGLPTSAGVVEPTHPAMVAFRAAGGRGTLQIRCPIPSGRGMGFSGAVRVAGVVGAHVQRHGVDGLDEARGELLDLAAELEGHADNVAASMYGGITVAAGGQVQRLPCPLDPALVAWIPDAGSTSTDASRSRLPSRVEMDDAVFNLANTALLVAALAAGNVAVLRTATADRLHQAQRLAAAPASAAALQAALASPAWAAWLSGSGPTVLAMCDPAAADQVTAALPGNGRVLRLSIAQHGAEVVSR